MRLFVAVNFDDAVKSRLLRIQDRIRSQAVQGNFSRPENLHLTIVFIGETPADKVPLVSSIVKKAGLPPQRPFSLDFSRTGCFKHGNKELWWIGADKDDPGLQSLTALRQRAADSFLEAGLAFDSRPFNAHITLGREIKHKLPIALNDERIPVPISRLSLMKSERIGGLLTYTEIFGIDLFA
jgi:2'-5' RNA ligase